MKKLKVGLLGMGRIGRLHGDNITYFVKNAEIIAAADPMLNSTMEEWAAELGIPKVYSDPMKVVQDPEVEAVFICTSTPAHAELSIAAAKAGKHIFCEKPVHTDLSEIRKILAAVEKAGVKFQVGFVRRFDHNHKAVRDTVASGKLGAPSVVKVTSRDPADQPMEYIATSGGIHIDMTIHDFDMVRYLSGSEVTEVVAYGSCANPDYAQYNDVDTTIIMLKFENGALGVIDNTRASKYGYDQRTEVQCVGGCVQVSNDLENTAMISSAEGVSSAKWYNAFGSCGMECICQPEGVIGDARMADGEKAKAGVERTLDYLTKLVNDILEKYPAGKLPPIDKMTQRNPADIEAVIKGPNVPGGRHIYTLEY